jgi:hypothetical protein
LITLTLADNAAPVNRVGYRYQIRLLNESGQYALGGLRLLGLAVAFTPPSGSTNMELDVLG